MPLALPLRLHSHPLRLAPKGVRPGAFRPATILLDGRFLPAAVDAGGTEILIDEGIASDTRSEALAWVRDRAHSAQVAYPGTAKRHLRHLRDLALALAFVLLPAAIAVLAAPGMSAIALAFLLGTGTAITSCCAMRAIETSAQMASMSRELFEIDTRR